MMSISNVYLPWVITHISPPQYKISDVKARLALISGSLHQVVKTIILIIPERLNGSNMKFLTIANFFRV